MIFCRSILSASPHSLILALLSRLQTFLLVFFQLSHFYYFLYVFLLLFIGFETCGINRIWSCGSTSEARVTGALRLEQQLTPPCDPPLSLRLPSDPYTLISWTALSGFDDLLTIHLSIDRCAPVSRDALREDELAEYPVLARHWPIFQLFTP